jgi:hypothetical protein
MDRVEDINLAETNKKWGVRAGAQNAVGLYLALIFLGAALLAIFFFKWGDEPPPDLNERCRKKAPKKGVGRIHSRKKNQAKCCPGGRRS